MRHRGRSWSGARHGLAAGIVAALVVAACSPTGGAGIPTATPLATGPGGTAPAVASAPASPPASPTVEPAASPAEPTTTPLGARPIGPTERATVVRVVDGDTIVIDRGYGDERLRYIGVDTPETVAPGSPVEWMGPEASAANKRLVEGRDVILERDVSEVDRFGRLLRYVWIEDASQPTGWTFVNLALVASGFAQVVTYPPDVRYVELYLAAQRTARDAGLGLWGQESAAPAATPAQGAACDPAYPTVCIPPSPPDLDCGDITFRRFTVLAPDPHRFDSDHDGIGCES